MNAFDRLPSRPRYARALDVNWIMAAAEDCLRLEVNTWPKPGLVSHVDAGSHTDMTAETFYRSAAAIRPFFGMLLEGGASGAAMPELRRIGLNAERAMLAATGGINTHRGAIFGLGLLCAAAGARAAGLAPAYYSLGQVVRSHWGQELLGGPRPADSHGAIVARKHGISGARSEASGGFSSIYQHALPVLCDASLQTRDPEAVRVQACFTLIATTEDTNLVHRGGLMGLRFAQLAARRFLRDGGIMHNEWRSRAAAIHQSFVSRRLSAGGSADLLAMSLFVQRIAQREVLP